MTNGKSRVGVRRDLMGCAGPSMVVPYLVVHDTRSGEASANSRSRQE